MIGFTAPWALLGLAAAAIPLLLHLFARREPPTVVFPATRYLAETARVHHRRLTFQHWLLLLIRTLIIALIAVAAAGPTLPSAAVGAHAPAAMVLVLDNSLSSGATVDGNPLLESLRRGARAILAAAGAEDALWLITADGTPRKGTAVELEAIVGRIGPEPRRLDLGAAIESARQATAGRGSGGTTVVLSDLQASAVSAVPVGPGALVVVRPEAEPVANLGIAGLAPGRQPWGPEGGRVTVTISGAGARNAAIGVRVGERPPRQHLVSAGVVVSLPSGSIPPGWWPVHAELEPDELRMDDVRVGAVRVAPPARATWRSDERFLGVAAEVLLQNGRLVRGTDLTIGSLGSGPSIVQPPADPAGLGALNRALAARGAEWRYTDLVPGSSATDSNPILGRHRILRRYGLDAPGRGSAITREILVTADGAPWLVRDRDLLLLGSRLEPDWTELPLSAQFVPFVDFLANRAARGEVVQLEAAPGELVVLPPATTTLVRDGLSRPIGGGEGFRPSELGLAYLLSGPDTIGVLAVNPDPRESEMERVGDRTIRQLWPGARVVGLRDAGTAAFAAGGRADLRGTVLLVVALLALADAALAGRLPGMQPRKSGPAS